MGALVRGRQANRYRAIIQSIPGVPDEKLAAIIEGYDDGCCVTDEEGEPIRDAAGKEVGSLDYAWEKLSHEEQEAFITFNQSLRDGSHPDIGTMADAAEDEDGEPSGYNPGGTPHQRLMALLSDILSDLP